jgi:hypothetical protein
MGTRSMRMPVMHHNSVITKSVWMDTAVVVRDGGASLRVTDVRENVEEAKATIAGLFRCRDLNEGAAFLEWPLLRVLPHRQLPGRGPIPTSPSSPR